MRVPVILLALGFLFAGLPLLHGRLVLLALDDAFSDPHALPLFYLYIVPAWVLANAVYALETFRRRIVGHGSGTGTTPLLGLLGMAMPTVGLALSPLAAELRLAVWAGVAFFGLVSGLVGALLFGLAMLQIDRFAGR